LYIRAWQGYQAATAKGIKLSKAGLFDTHAHFEGADEEIGALLARAAGSGVSSVLAVGGSPSLNAGALAAQRLAAATSLRLPVALGWDRDQAGKSLPELDLSNVAAVGEIGLDYYYEGAGKEAQLELFSSQLEKARALDKPVVIHTREADGDTLGALREVPSRGVIHCFTGSPDFCRRLLDLGFYVSISGIVTFRLADNVREVAKLIPDDRLLIETDSPFLAPVPMRGKANEPAFVAHTARFLADLRGMDYDEFVALTAGNAEKLFFGGSVA
jgi:TatD DNase family protein